MNSSGFFKAMTALLVVAFTLAIPALGQQKEASQAIWESGNVFLRQCDDNNADFAQLSAREKQVSILVCDFWVEGIRQGIEMVQQERPATPVSPAVQKENKAYVEDLKKEGIEPLYTHSMCIPNDVTVDQLRLVVLQWMKANPTKLDQHGALLTYAALSGTYPCPVKGASK